MCPVDPSSFQVVVTLEAGWARAATDAGLKGQVEELIKEAAASKARQAILAAPRLINLVTQVLLVAIGRQTLRTTTSTRFQEWGPGDPLLQRLADATGLPSNELVTWADAVITARNAAVHPVNKAALDEEVRQVRQLLTPEVESLSTTCKWACRFLARYEAIVNAFPQEFR